MPSIDERIVAMSFENAKFEAAVAQTMGTLTKLDTAIKNIGSTNGLQNIEKAASGVTLQAPMSALDRLKGRLSNVGVGASQGFSEIDRAGNRVTLGGVGSAIDKTQAKLGQLGAGSTFTDIEKAADRTDLSGLSSALDNVSNKFSVLQGAASVALGNIASQAAMRGAAFAKSFALGPIQQGFQEYGTNLGSIQTILANTQDSGGNLKTVNAALNELNTYSDKTIYNFTEMAKNIGTFTAAGVQLKPATESIKGIANLAALSGSNSQQASTAMYQLSQAIAAGRVGLQDWNSVVNAGMGGAVFQKALMRTAETMHTVKDGAVQIDKATGKATINGESFRESIQAKPGQQSWLTSDVLTKTLAQFTGDLKASDLAAQGFNASQIKAIQQTAKSAQNAATQVKTLPQVFDVARETIGSGWAKTFQLIFGNFNQSKNTFTALSNTINGFINRTSKARNALLTAFDGLGGRDKLINAIKAAFSALASAIRPVTRAFRAIFPPETAQGLINLVTGFQHLSESMQGFFLRHAGQLENTFKGLFAVLHIVWTVIKDVVRAFGRLAGTSGGLVDDFLNFTSSIGLFLEGLDKAISSGASVNDVFKRISGALKGPINALKQIGGLIGALFAGFTGRGWGQASGAFQQLEQSAGPLQGVFLAAVKGVDKLREALRKVADFVKPIFTDAINTVHDFAGKISNALQSINFDDATKALTTAGIGGIFFTLKKALGGGGGLNLKFFDGVRTQVVTTLNAVNGSLGAIQQNVKANTLLQIGVAIAVLAGGIFILSKIDPESLTRSMTAVAVGLGELVGAFRLLGRAGGLGAMAVMPLIGASLIEMAIAIDLLAFAVGKFSKLSWEGIAKGLAGVLGLLVAVAGATQHIPPRMMTFGLALIPLAVGIDLLAVAVKIFGGMSWESLAKGLSSLAISLGIIGLGLEGIGPSALLVGPGLIAVSAGMILLSGAVASFGRLDVPTIAKGLLAMAFTLDILGVAIKRIPMTIALQAAGLVILGVALTELGVALGIIGNLKVSTLAKGLITIALALDIFSMGLTAMSGTLPGSLALLAAATGLAVLTPVLIALGNVSWSVLLKGLGAMALSIGALALVSVVAGPALVVLGVGLLAVGVGLLAVSTAVYIAAKGISLLAANGQLGVAALITALTGMVAMIPNIVINFVQGLVSIVGEIAKLAPQIAEAIGKLLDVLTRVIIENAPKIAVAAGVLIDSFLMIVNDNAGNIIASGIKLLETFLSGIANNIGQVTHQAAMIITGFLVQLNADGPRLIAQGAHVLMMFLNGIAVNLASVMAAAANVVLAFFNGIVTIIPRMALAGMRVVTQFLNGVAQRLPLMIAAGANVVVQFFNGIGNAIPRIVEAGGRLVRKFIFAISNELPKMVDAGFKAVIRFINGVARAVRTNTQPMIDAGFNLASAIIDGMVSGFKQLAHKAISAVGHVITALPRKAIKLLGIGSPSKVFQDIGVFTMLGLERGLNDGAAPVGRSIDRTANGMVKTLSSSLSGVPKLLDGVVDMNPVISPVLDLTHVEKHAGKLADLTNVTPITAAASYQQASTLTQDVAATQAAQVAQAPVEAGVKLEFHQTNTSPEALSASEIYRRTNNQLSIARRALGAA